MRVAIFRHRHQLRVAKDAPPQPCSWSTVSAPANCWSGKHPLKHLPEACSDLQCILMALVMLISAASCFTISVVMISTERKVRITSAPKVLPLNWGSSMYAARCRGLCILFHWKNLATDFCKSSSRPTLSDVLLHQLSTDIWGIPVSSFHNLSLK